LSAISDGLCSQQFYDFILPEIREELDAQAVEKSGKGSSLAVTSF